MKIIPSIASAIASFFSNLVVAVIVYRFLAATSAWTIGVGIFAAGFCLGLIHGWIFGKRCVRRIGLWAFIAVCVLWTPVVLTTYGFALLGLPLLAAYALVVFIGARFSADRPLWNTKNVE
jgi:hypothetical protein